MQKSFIALLATACFLTVIPLVTTAPAQAQGTYDLRRTAHECRERGWRGYRCEDFRARMNHEARACRERGWRGRYCHELREFWGGR
jgi:hypothetical protein